LEEKKGELKKGMAGHVESGELTRREKKLLREQVEGKIEVAEGNLVGKEGKQKEKIEGVIKKLKDRKDAIEGAKIAWAPKLKVRQSNEQSDELTTQSQAAKTAHTLTSVQDAPFPKPPRKCSLIIPTVFAIRFAHCRLSRRLINSGRSSCL